MHEDLDRAWKEIHRVLAEGGWACINIGDATRTLDGRFRLYPNHARVLSACASLGFDILPSIVWRKPTNAPNKFMGSGMLPAGAYVTLEHEYILLMRKGTKREFTLADEKQVRRRSAIFWEERNRWFSDIWDFNGTRQNLANGDSRERSAAFPFELPFRLINMYSVREDVVLDPFAGTGTTILAAMASGRNSFGVDIDEGMLHALRAETPHTVKFLNAFLEERTAEHNRFVEEHSRDKGELPHRNRLHGFPVMTAQEEELTLEYIDQVRRCDDGSILVSYRGFPTTLRNS
jgi:DNA modification methylase